MNYLWKMWRLAVDARNWDEANRYADLIDAERLDQRREKLARMKEKLKYSLMDSEKTNGKAPRLNENEQTKATIAGVA